MLDQYGLKDFEVLKKLEEVIKNNSFVIIQSNKRSISRNLFDFFEVVNKEVIIVECMIPSKMGYSFMGKVKSLEEKIQDSIYLLNYETKVRLLPKDAIVLLETKPGVDNSHLLEAAKILNKDVIIWMNEPSNDNDLIWLGQDTSKDKVLEINTIIYHSHEDLVKKLDLINNNYSIKEKIKGIRDDSSSDTKSNGLNLK